MSSYALMLDAGSAVVRRAGAVYAEGLDAWLGTDTSPVEPSSTVGVATPRGDLTTDWSAPCWSVDLTYDTADTVKTERSSGIRPILQEGSRRLMFDLQAYEILVRVASLRLSEQYLLEGQVLFEGLPLPGAAVRLQADRTGSTDLTAVLTAVLTDRLGGFRLPPLVRGAYGLQIAVEGAVLAVPRIALR